MSDKHTFSALDWLRLLAVVTWLVLLVRWPQLTFASTLLIIGAGLIGYNAWIFWLSIVLNEDAPSIAPVFGGISAAAGIVLLPVAGSWLYCWIPLLVDWGGLPFYLTHWYLRCTRP